MKLLKWIMKIIFILPVLYILTVLVAYIVLREPALPEALSWYDSMYEKYKSNISSGKKVSKKYRDLYQLYISSQEKEKMPKISLHIKWDDRKKDLDYPTKSEKENAEKSIKDKKEEISRAITFYEEHKEILKQFDLKNYSYYGCIAIDRDYSDCPDIQLSIVPDYYELKVYKAFLEVKREEILENLLKYKEQVMALNINKVSALEVSYFLSSLKVYLVLIDLVKKKLDVKDFNELLAGISWNVEAELNALNFEFFYQYLVFENRFNMNFARETGLTFLPDVIQKIINNSKFIKSLLWNLDTSLNKAYLLAKLAEKNSENYINKKQLQDYPDEEDLWIFLINNPIGRLYNGAFGHPTFYKKMVQRWHDSKKFTDIMLERLSND